MFSQEIKPNKRSFIMMRLVWPLVLGACLFVIILAVAAYDLVPNFVISPALLAAAAIVGFSWLNAAVAYDKRKYRLESDRIVQYGGALFTDSQTELLVKNITHVRRVYPFVENKLFSTGHVYVEAAGSQESEVSFQNMDEAQAVLEAVEKLMGENGFILAKGKLKHQEQPHPLGVFFEVFKGVLGGLAIILFAAGQIIAEQGAAILFLVFEYAGLSIILLALLAIPLAVKSILYFLDLLKREYNIYENMITYTEGFLTKHYAFIPFRNLSDSATTQTFIDRLFGLYDVKLSAQGSGHEILFKNLVRGPEISRTLDKLIDAYEEQAPPAEQVADREQAAAPQAGEARAPGSKPVRAGLETEFTAEFQMNFARHLLSLVFYAPLVLLAALFPAVLLSLMAVVVVNAVPLILQAKFTRFQVKRKAMYRQYKFLTTKEIEFTNEKITGVVVKRNFIDYWMGTATIRFYSIGSATDLDFTHIDYDPELIARGLAKTGLTPEHRVFQIDSRFSFLESLKAGFFLVVLLVVLAAGWLLVAGNLLASAGYNPGWALAPLLVIAFGWLVLYVYQIFYYRRSKLMVHEDVVYFQKGIFFKDFFYARYDNLKDITTTRYPFSREGDLRFNIAGEKIVQTQQGKSVQSHSFKIKYVPDIPVQDELIDYILLNRPSAEVIKKYLVEFPAHKTEILHRRQPSLKNPLFVTVLVLLLPNLSGLFLAASGTVVNNVILLLLGLLLFADVLVLAWVALYTRMISYTVEDARVLARWGIFYKKQTSVVFGKIDFLNNSQGVVNKLFGNGNITVNTIGSSRPELTLKNLDDYREFYRLLKGVYKNY